MDNIDTVTAIYQAVRFGEPLMSRIVTVTGDAVQNPCNFEVPVGMLLSELLEQAGGLKNEAVKIICGGPMMGRALFTMDVPVTKTTSALTALRRMKYLRWHHLPASIADAVFPSVRVRFFRPAFLFLRSTVRKRSS